MAVNLQQTAAPVVSLTGTLASTAVVTGLAATSALAVGMIVQGVGIPASTLITSIDSSTQVTLTQSATASGSAALTFLLEPITLAEAKLHLRVDFPQDDSLIASLITTARRLCETASHRAFLSTTFLAMWDSFPFGGGYYNRQLRQFYGAFPGAMGATFPGFLPSNTGIIEVSRPPLLSVNSIQYYDASGNFQTLSPTVYNVETGIPGRIAPAYGQIWPTTYPRMSAVQISFTSGYGTTALSVPENVKTGIKLTLGYLYANRNAINAGATVDLPPSILTVLCPEEWGAYG